MQVNRRIPTISVVIPTRNEAKNLYHLLPLIPPEVTEIILVDGHSIDDTIQVAQTLRPDIQIIEQEGKGKGDAMRLGFAASTQDIVVMLDADGSADPAEIMTFAQALINGGDFAKGSRFIKGGGSHDITLLRRLGNLGLCVLVNILFKERFSDLCYGYNAFWRRCLDDIRLDGDGFDIEAQLCIQMHKAGFTLIEVPSMEHARIHGESNLNTFKDGWLVLKVILREWLYRGSTRFVPNRKSQEAAHVPDESHVSPVEEVILSQH